MHREISGNRQADRGNGVGHQRSLSNVRHGMTTYHGGPGAIGTHAVDDGSARHCSSNAGSDRGQSGAPDRPSSLGVKLRIVMTTIAAVIARTRTTPTLRTDRPGAASAIDTIAVSNSSTGTTVYRDPASA